MTGMPRRRASLWIEYAFVAAIIAGIVWTAWFLWEYRYLPQPWFYEPSGTFMDWYSLSIWGHVRGAYEVAGVIYPPLSFVVISVFSDGRCYPHYYSEWARACDPAGIYALTGILLINVVLTFLTFRKHDRECYLPRAFALSLGFPMLFAFERGNLLLFCYTAVLLGFGPLLKSARWRWFFAGVALNFKIYLVSAIAAPLLRRRWLTTEAMLLWGVIVYLATWQILGEGNPWEIYRNLTTYVGGFGANGFLDLWYAGSFNPAISLLKGETFPITTVLDSQTIDVLLVVATAYMRGTQLLIIIAAAVTWLRPDVVPPHRIYFLAIALALSVSEAGGYTQILLMIFIFMEKWRGVGRPLAIVIAYALCVPAEYVFFEVPPLVRTSFLAGDAHVITTYGVGAASILRLVGIYLVTICLACVTIADVWRDVRMQGWKDRWRFRRDAAVLPGVQPPQSPLAADRAHP